VNAWYNWLLTDWHWLIIWIVLGMAAGSVNGAFKAWSKHRIAVVQAAHPAVLPLVQLQPAPATAGPSAAAVEPKLVECQHYAPNVTAVLDHVTCERHAWYCQACDQQLPASWALSESEGR
jgi:hypothetical protein